MISVQSNNVQKNKKETIENLCTKLPKWVILREIYFALLIWPILPFILFKPFLSLLEVISTAIDSGYSILATPFMLYVCFGGLCSISFFKQRIKKIKNKVKTNTHDRKTVLYFWPLIPIIGFVLSYLTLSVINSNIIHSVGIVFSYIIFFGWILLGYLFFPQTVCKSYHKKLFWFIFILIVPFSIGRLTNCEPAGWSFGPLYFWIFGVLISILCLKAILKKSVLLSFIVVIFLFTYSFLGCSLHQRLSCFLNHGESTYRCWNSTCSYFCQKQIKYLDKY